MHRRGSRHGARAPGAEEAAGFAHWLLLLLRGSGVEAGGGYCRCQLGRDKRDRRDRRDKRDKRWEICHLCDGTGNFAGDDCWYCTDGRLAASFYGSDSD